MRACSGAAPSWLSRRTSLCGISGSVRVSPSSDNPKFTHNLIKRRSNITVSFFSQPASVQAVPGRLPLPISCQRTNEVLGGAHRAVRGSTCHWLVVITLHLYISLLYIHRSEPPLSQFSGLSGASSWSQACRPSPSEDLL